jgi:hypothetical protein
LGETNKGSWADELPSILWAIRTTPQSATRETPFRLTYGMDAMIPVEIKEPSVRVEHIDMIDQTNVSHEQLDLLPELRELAYINQISLKDRISKRYNRNVKPRSFMVGDLVLRRANMGNRCSKHGKLAANWEGPYRVSANLSRGAYELETLKGNVLKRSWNVSDLRRFYC